MEIIKIFNLIISDILRILYKDLGAALIISFLIMFFFMRVEKEGIKKTLKIWIKNFKEDKQFRKIFAMAFFGWIYLFKTILGQSIWLNPLSNIWGIWGVYDQEGKVYVVNIINIILCIALIFCLLTLKEREKYKITDIFVSGIKKSIEITVLTEFIQVFFRTGNIQLSDFVFNIIGGMIGIGIFIVYKK